MIRYKLRDLKVGVLQDVNTQWGRDSSTNILYVNAGTAYLRCIQLNTVIVFVPIDSSSFIRAGRLLDQGARACGDRGECARPRREQAGNGCHLAVR